MSNFEGTLLTGVYGSSAPCLFREVSFDLGDLGQCVFHHTLDRPLAVLV